jgi:hypothetical protein
MTLRNRLAALAVAGLTLPGCTYPLVAPHVPHESHGLAAEREVDDGPSQWLAIFNRRSKKRDTTEAAPRQTRWAALAKQLEERGETAEAEKLYQAALREDPDDGVVHHRLGVLLAKRGETALAHQHLESAALHNPASVEAANDFGYCCFLQGRYAEAEASLRRALELKPDHTIAANNLANVLRERAAQDAARPPALPLKRTATPVQPSTTPPETATRRERTDPQRGDASPKVSSEEAIVVVLPEPATDEGQTEAVLDNEFTAERNDAPSALPHPGDVDESPSSLPAERQVVSPPVEVKSADAQSQSPPAEVQKSAAEKVTSRVEGTSSVGRASSAGAIVRVLDEERFAAPCASPAKELCSPPAEDPSTDATAGEVVEEIRISSPSVSVSPTAAPRPIPETAGDEFVRYEPAEASSESTSAAEAPRRRLFGSEGIVSRVERSLLDELPLNSLRQQESDGELNSQATTPAPQENQPQPRRRSLLSTLRSLSPLGGERRTP